MSVSLMLSLFLASDNHGAGTERAASQCLADRKKTLQNQRLMENHGEPWMKREPKSESAVLPLNYSPKSFVISFLQTRL
jgi:hypothetical protein